MTKNLPLAYYSVRVIVQPMGEVFEFRMMMGSRLSDAEKAIIAILGEEYRECLHWHLEQHYIEADKLHLIKPKSGTIIRVKALPQLELLAFAAAAFVSGFVESALLAAGVSALTASVIAAAAGALASYAVTQLFSPPTRLDETRNESPTYSITGARNRITPYAPVPVVLGKHRFVPPYGAAPYTEVVGNDQYLRFVVVWGYGPVSVSDVKIGNTLISEYNDVTIENDFTGSLDTLTLYPETANQEQLNIRIGLLAASPVEITTVQDTDEISVTYTLPYGLFNTDDKGNIVSESVQVVGEYRPISGGSWTQFFSTVTTNSTTKLQRLSEGVDVTRGSYEVRLYRVDAEQDGARRKDVVVWTALRSFKNEDPIKMDGIAKSAYRIRATDQLSGVVDELNAVVQSKAETWNGAAWGGSNATSNPAALFRYVLTGAANGRPVSTSRLNEAALGDWYDFCVTNSLEYNEVMDYRASVESMLKKIAAAGMAAPINVDGLYSVAIDEVKDTVIQHFTQRNSSQFGGARHFVELPHGLRVRFLNRDTLYREDERVVFDDGYTDANATNYELLELPGVTDPAQVYRLARHYLASIRLRPEVFSFLADVEQIVCNKGDRIRLTHDVPMIGQTSGRVKAIAGNVLTLDEEITLTLGTVVTIIVRTINDGMQSFDVIPTITSTGKTIDLGATPTGVAIGDLFMIGDKGNETLDLIIRSIEPEDELAARIEAIPYSPEVFNAATSIPEYSSILSDPVSRSLQGPPTPIISGVQTDETAMTVTPAGDLQPGIFIYLQPGVGLPGGNADMTLTESYRARFRKTGSTDPYIYVSNIPVDTASALLQPVDVGAGYDISAQAVSPVGRTSDWVTITNQIVVGAVAPPDDVSGFGANTIDRVTYLTWDKVSVIDLDHYEIRYQPVTTGATWGGSTLIARQASNRDRQIAVPSRNGTYLIKAVDYLGNKSVNAVLIVDTLIDPEAFNAVETITESPTFAGTKVNVTVAAGKLQLGSASVMSDWATMADALTLSYGSGQGLESDGTYTFGGNPIDLGQVFTSRLTANVAIDGLDILDAMSGWATLAGVATLAGSAAAAPYDVFFEVRTTEDDPVGSPSWTAWREFVTGDYTARGFEFRLRLISTINTVTPRVSSLVVDIDMPDREARGKDVVSGTGVKSVIFSPSFNTMEVVGITAQNLATGDYFNVDSKTRTGFDIQFFNSSDVGVSRTFDWNAIGYGREQGT